MLYILYKKYFLLILLNYFIFIIIQFIDFLVLSLIKWKTAYQNVFVTVQDYFLLNERNNVIQNYTFLTIQKCYLLNTHII